MAHKIQMIGPKMMVSVILMIIRKVHQTIQALAILEHLMTPNLEQIKVTLLKLLTIMNLVSLTRKKILVQNQMNLDNLAKFMIRIKKWNLETRDSAILKRGVDKSKIVKMFLGSLMSQIIIKFIK